MGWKDFSTGVCGSCWAGTGYGRFGAVQWLWGGSVVVSVLHWVTGR
jgi:hypothetical protein